VSATPESKEIAAGAPLRGDRREAILRVARVALGEEA